MVEDIGNYTVEELKEYGEKYFNYVKEVRGVDLTYYGNWQRDFGQLVIDMADLKSNTEKEWQTLLDVGCACGLNIRAYDELNIFEKIYGSDISSHMINNIIPQLYENHQWNAKMVNWSDCPAWDQYTIQDNNIDLIISTHVLEHLPSKSKLNETLKEFKRILHPDGKILIIVPTKSDKYDPSDALVHVINEDAVWWLRTFQKFFKSESSEARNIFKSSKLKPDRNGHDTFYKTYNHVWTIYRLINK